MGQRGTTSTSTTTPGYAVARGLALGVALACMLWASPAGAHVSVDSARQAYEEGQFRVALSRLTAAEQDPTLTRAQLVQLHWVRAASFHALGQVADAGRSLDQLLVLDPLFEPSIADATPPLMAVFEGRRLAWRQQHEVTLEAPALNAAGQVTLVLGGKVAEVVNVLAFARAPGVPEYTRVPLKLRSGTARGAIIDDALWDACTQAGVVELVVEARNPSGATVARLGTATRPIVVPMPVDPEPVAQPPPLPTPPPVPDTTPSPPSPAQVGEDRPGAMMDLPVTPQVVGTPQAVDPVPATPATPWRPPWQGALGGGLLALGGVAVVVALGAAGVSALLYVALWLFPRSVGGDVDPGFRAVLAGWVAGGVAAGLALVVALGFAAAGGASLLWASISAARGPE